jgi:hypothetical protein
VGEGTRDLRGSVSGERGPAVEAWSERRRLYLDNLKVLLVAAIIAGHGVAGYADVEFWPYAEMREITLTDATTIGLLALIGPFALVMIPSCSWSPACSPLARWHARALPGTRGTDS